MREFFQFCDFHFICFVILIKSEYKHGFFSYLLNGLWGFKIRTYIFFNNSRICNSVVREMHGSQIMFPRFENICCYFSPLGPMDMCESWSSSSLTCGYWWELELILPTRGHWWELELILSVSWTLVSGGVTQCPVSAHSFPLGSRDGTQLSYCISSVFTHWDISPALFSLFSYQHYIND